MICYLCGKDKLSNEFPFEHLTEECDHPLLHCLRCATASVQNSGKCSECGAIVEADNEQYHKYTTKLSFLFPDSEATEHVLPDTSDFGIAGDSSPSIMIATLAGEYTTITYNPSQTVYDLKITITEKLGPPSNKQRLLYEDVELKTFDDNNELLTIKDFNVRPSSTIHLIILLYAVPDGLDHVIFDLFWGYPESGRDYLDASVLLYSGSTFVEVVDYCHTQCSSSMAVTHSGDVMDDQNRLGHHVIEVSLKSVPPRINKLVFTLSAWNSPNISKYRNPSLQFFDKKFPDKQLCNDEMSHAAYSQAIIMCGVSKRYGRWHVFSLKKCSGGNAKDYGPLQSKIAGLIQHDYI